MLTDLEVEKIKNLVKMSPIIGLDDIHLDLISKYLEKLNDGDIILELGTWMGGSISYFAKRFPNLIFHTVDLCDPYLWHNFYAQSPSSRLFQFLKKINLSLINPKDIVEIQKAHIEGLNNIVTHIGDSVTVDISDIALLLIDTEHTEEKVLSELEFYFPKMKKNGYIFGDDYLIKGVKTAFEKFAKKYNLALKSYGNMGLIIIDY